MEGLSRQPGPWIAACLLTAFLLAFASSGSAQEVSHSIGVAPYVQPRSEHIRLLFGYGGNAGLSQLTPSSFVGNATYQSGTSELIAGFISSTSLSNDLPRRSYSEFELMYGVSINELLVHYEGPSDGLHTSLSGGISLESYQERWRPYGRRPGPYLFYPPTSFRYSLGLPIQFQAIYEPLRYAGIGALLFYTVSGFSPSYGGALVIEARY